MFCHCGCCLITSRRKATQTFGIRILNSICCFGHFFSERLVFFPYWLSLASGALQNGLGCAIGWTLVIKGFGIPHIQAGGAPVSAGRDQHSEPTPGWAQGRCGRHFLGPRAWSRLAGPGGSGGHQVAAALAEGESGSLPCSACPAVTITRTFVLASCWDPGIEQVSSDEPWSAASLIPARSKGLQTPAC